MTTVYRHLHDLSEVQEALGEILAFLEVDGRNYRRNHDEISVTSNSKSTKTDCRRLVGSWAGSDRLEVEVEAIGE